MSTPEPPTEDEQRAQAEREHGELLSEMFRPTVLTDSPSPTDQPTPAEAEYETDTDEFVAKIKEALRE